MCNMSPELAHAADRPGPRAARRTDQGGPRRRGADPARAGRCRTPRWPTCRGSRAASAAPAPSCSGPSPRRLGVTLDYLAYGEGWEDAGRLELQLDHAELSLVGGEGEQRPGLAREALALARPRGRARRHHPRPLRRGGRARRARRPAAAVRAFQALLNDATDASTGSRPPPRCAASGASRASSSGPSPARRPSSNTLTADVTRHRGGHPALGDPGRRPVHGRPRRWRPPSCATRPSPSPSGSARRWPAPRRTGTPASSAPSPATSPRRSRWRSARCTCSRTPSGCATSAGSAPSWARSCCRTDPPRLEDAQRAAAARRRRAGVERGQPRRPRPARVGQRAGPLHRRATPRGHTRRALAVLEPYGDELPLLSVEALILLGQVAWSTGDREDAQDWYRRAIAMLTGCRRRPRGRPGVVRDRHPGRPGGAGGRVGRRVPPGRRVDGPAPRGSRSSTPRPRPRRGRRRCTLRPVGFRSSTPRPCPRPVRPRPGPGGSRHQHPAGTRRARRLHGPTVGLSLSAPWPPVWDHRRCVNCGRREVGSHAGLRSR